MGLISFLKKKFGSKKEANNKYVVGMEKSRKQFSSRLKSLAKKYEKVNEEYFENLLQILIEADVGVNLTFSIIEATKKEANSQGISDPTTINEILVDKMFIGYLQQGEDIVNEITFVEDRPTVLLIVGVNGVGKTTTIAKLAKRYQNMRKRVLLVAGDTFRAGAVEQLEVWAKRLNVDIVTGKKNQDPASVAYDGVARAVRESYDLVIIDTAGRVQSKAHLMDELSKIRRVISRQIEGAPDEVFLIIDATTGQNGVIQAKAFAEATGLTGVVITKMDGTSKGGIILAIRDEIGVPVRFIGLGESLDDLEEFDLEKYLYGLCLGDDDVDI
ncbi:MAG: signal recognition particle-docking protein FtsY [Erysipelotrichaceae bacterium]|nr:signal recognition particle-docking protein FtsY [Bacillota bacterium]NLJ32514.1 signal recognition particle-docking protein FtsY [Erysipelotrichaceae bacterium]